MSKQNDILAHRSFVFESFTASVSTFYAVLERAVSIRAIPGTTVSRILLSEGGLLGAKREYVRIRRGAEVFDVCAAAVGESFMVSHWLRRIPRHRAWIKWVVGFFLLLPFIQFVSPSLNERITGCCAMILLPFFIVGPALLFLRLIPGAGLFFKASRLLFGWAWRLLKLPTLFQSDTADLFRKTIPAIVEETIEALRSGQALLGKTGLQALSPALSE